MLSCFYLKKKKKKTKGLDRMVLATGSCGPTPLLGVHGINKKSGFLCLKNWFSSRFPIFTIRPPGPARIGFENLGHYQTQPYAMKMTS